MLLNIIVQSDLAQYYSMVGFYVAQNTVKVIWRLSSFTGGGSPCIIRTTNVPQTSWTASLHERSQVLGGILTHSGEGQVILSQLNIISKTI